MSKPRRSFHVSTLCLLASSLGGLAAGCAVAAESPPAEEIGEAAQAVVFRQAWTTVAAPYIDHQAGAAVLLGNGKVLVTNGRDTMAEIYDPVTNTWAHTPDSPENPSYFDFKYYQTASLLPSGNVAVSTGYTGSIYGDYYLYDAANGLWTMGMMPGVFASTYHAGVTLQDGRAVTTGGTALNTSYTRIRAFNEPTLTWSTIGELVRGRERHTSTVLDDGRILSAGGYNYTKLSGGSESTELSSAEIFDPATGESAYTGCLATARLHHTATRLANRKVLVAGGTPWITPLASSELYDPDTGTWSSTGSLTVGRTDHKATLLQDGRVLLTGGFTGTTELYDPATGTWSAGSPMNVTTRPHTATLLADGRVLVVGSVNYVPTAEIYDPSPQCVTFQRGSFGATADTQISTGALTKNYGASVVANIGEVAGTARLALFYFDLSPIPAKSTVISSTLSLYASAYSGPPKGFAVHSVMLPWAETTITWNSFGGAFEADAVASVASSDAVGWRSVNITGLVQSWQMGAIANNGLILTKSVQDGSFTSFATGEATLASTRPALEVCFVAP